MNRWIDAEAFERAVMFSDDEDLQDVIYRLRDYPSIDIVRCKECKWHHYDTDDECRWRIEEIPKDDDFCSYGERAEQTKPNSSEKPNNCEDEPQTETYNFKGIIKSGDGKTLAIVGENEAGEVKFVFTDCSWK